MSDTPRRPKIGIIGIGMVGTPIKEWFERHAAPLQRRERGVDLFCRDADPAKGYGDDINEADVIFVCVPTPPGDFGRCDTSIVRRVVSGIAPGKVVVIKSTVPPGTVQGLQTEFPDLAFLFSPEFLTESRAGEDFRNPSRQIVAPTPEGYPHASRVAALLPRGQTNWPDAPIYGPLADATSTEAELAKYASNWFGALKVTFANILADISYVIGRVHGTTCRYEAVRDMVGADKRILPTWMDVGHGAYHGYGGYCFPKDTVALEEFTGQLEKAFLDMTGAQRDAHDSRMANLLRAGRGLMNAMRDYNTALLEAQGLTVDDVSYHDKDIVLKKRRRIREPK